eukprot:TRINITY_DN7665_c0_g1_i2.p1 TRINITY_DN7665_c0_g1~~TRINITY_DN7665_c0_g1_i2.p1  ORF type:complete len:292 (+),score=106.76 TRINITY_DN7665_c0_g1_i2:900-1775(+)
MEGLLLAVMEELPGAAGALRVLQHCVEWAAHAFDEPEELQQLLSVLVQAKLSRLLKPVQPAWCFAARLKLMQTVLPLLRSAPVRKSESGAAVLREAAEHLGPLCRLLSATPSCAVVQYAVMELLEALVQLRNPAVDAAVAAQRIPRLLLAQGTKRTEACLLRNCAARVLNAILERTDEAAVEMQASLAVQGEPSVFQILACTPVHHAFGKAVGAQLEQCAQRSVQLLTSLEEEPSWWRYRAQVLEPAWQADAMAEQTSHSAAVKFRQNSGYDASRFGKNSPSESFFFSGFD